jgi:hypothetical protein
MNIDLAALPDDVETLQRMVRALATERASLTEAQAEIERLRLIGQSLADRPLRSRGLMDGPAGPAAIARPADADDPKPRRHMIEHLADSLADHKQFTAAAGADLMLEIEPDVLAGQMRRQAWSIGPRSRRLDRR